MKDTSESLDTFQMGVHRNYTSLIFQNFNKRNCVCLLPLNCGFVFQYSKILWNRKYHPWRIHGQARYVPVNIWKSRWICLVGYGENSNWLWQAVYLQGVSGGSFYTWSTTIISSTRPSGNEWPSWSGVANIANYCEFDYGACTGFWLIYKFCINLHEWSYISCYNNQTLGKSGWWTN